MVVRPPSITRRIISRRRWAIVLLTLAMALSLGTAFGQDAPPSKTASPEKPVGAESPAAPSAPAAAAQPTHPPGGPVEEVKPEVFYLKDKDGNLQAVPGFTLEDFVRLYRLKNQLEQPEAEPRFSLQRMTVTGDASSDRAELTVEFRMLLNEAGWVRVPLRLGKAVLREPATYQGPGEGFVHFDDAVGYVAWLRGGVGSEHRLTLKMTFALAGAGTARRLELTAPRATTSKLTLKVPMSHAVAMVSAGGTLESSKSSGSGTEFTVLGLSGDFGLAWHEPEAQVATLPAALDVSGALVITMDDRQARTDATLNVRSLGGEFDEFRVRLPAGAKLIPAMNATGYKLEPDSDLTSRLVRVQLERKTAGPVDVLISTQQDSDLARPDDLLELGCFEVLDAAQQAGHMAVCVPSDWQVVWGPRHGVRQVDDLPEALRRKDVVAGFEYFQRAGEPSSLSARVIRRKTRVSVEPSYLLLIDPGAVRLEGRLKYTVRGAKVSRFQIDAPGWELDEIGPKNLVDVDEALGSEPPLLSVPLQSPTSGEIEITLRAHRTTAEGKTLEVQLPRPVADLPGPAEVVILPADNVELTPRPESFVGLARQLAAPTMKLPERQQEPEVYRGEAQQAKFVATAETHPQTISAHVFSQVQIDYRATRVEQRLAYNVAYEPIDRVVLDVPRAVAAGGSLEVTLDGERLVAGQAEDLQRGDTQLARIPFALGKQRISRFDIAVRYPLPRENAAPESGAVLPVELVMPGDADVNSSDLTVATEPGIGVDHRGGPWSVADDAQRRTTRLPSGARAVGRSGLHLVAKEATPLVELTLQFDDTRSGGLTVVERAWIQSWLRDGQRQDRAVLRIVSSDAQVRLTLPAGASASETEVLLDGVAVPPTIIPDEDLAVDWPAESPRRPHVLELRYRFAENSERPAKKTLDAPRLRGGAWVQRTYWQVMLPQNEHVLAAPSDWTGEYSWGWLGLGWARVPLVDQLQLESWSGATHQASQPEGANQYVYSSAGPTSQLSMLTASRSVLVLAGSSLVLAAGLLLTYVAACRHPLCFFAVAVLAVATGLLFPESVVLVAQAGTLGAVLAVAAAFWARSVSRRRPRRVVVRGGSPSSIDRTRTQTKTPRTISVGSHSSTTTDPIGVQVTAPEARS